MFIEFSAMKFCIFTIFLRLFIIFWVLIDCSQLLMESYPSRWQALIPSRMSSPPMHCFWNSGKLQPGQVKSFLFSPSPDLITIGKKRIWPVIFPSTSATSESSGINFGFFLDFQQAFLQQAARRQGHLLRLWPDSQRGFRGGF